MEDDMPLFPQRQRLGVILDELPESIRDQILSNARAAMREATRKAKEMNIEISLREIRDIADRETLLSMLSIITDNALRQECLSAFGITQKRFIPGLFN